MGLLSFGFSGQALAACDVSVPGDGATVTCTGADTTGISGNGNTVTVNLNSGSSINTTGTSAIDLGTTAQINVFSGSSVSSDASTITADGVSRVDTYAGSSVSSSTGVAIQYTGTAGQVFTVGAQATITGGAGVAIDFGTSLARFFLVGDGSNITGNVTAGAGVGDRIELTGSSNYSFNVNDIGTKYTGFEDFRKSGTGTATLTGTGAQAWTVNSGGGTLAGDTTSLSGNITNNAIVRFNQSSSGTYSSVMSGTGALQKSGTGTVTLSGANTYTGGTTVTGGAINIVNANNLGTGALTLDGGTLQYGAGISSGINTIIGAGGGTIDTNGFTSINNGSFSGSGALTKTGAGTYSIFGAGTHNGLITVSGGVLSTRTNALVGDVVNDATFQFNQDFSGTFAGQISGSGIVQMFSTPGTGVVTLTGNNTYTGFTRIFSGTLNVSADNNLGAAATEIRLQGTGTLQYGAGFASARNILLNTTGGSIDTNGFNSSISGVVSGSGALIKSGTGTLTLSGTNTNTGGITVTGGALSVSADANLGNASGGLTLDGGTLQYGAGFSSARTVALGAGGGSVDTNSFTSTLSGVVSGTGGLTKSGAGTLTLSGTNTYTGGTTVTGGILSISADTNLGGIGGITLNGGTLRFSTAVTTSRAVVLGAGNGTVDTGASTINLQGGISGAGALTKIGAGTLSLSGTSSYTGGTTVSAGTLRGDTTSLRGDIINNGTVNFNQNVTGTYSGVMSGTGALTKTLSGTVTLSGANTYSGGTTISAGTIVASASNNLGTGTVTLNGGTLQAGNTFDLTTSVVLGASNGTVNTNGFTLGLSSISGTGSLTKNGAGTLRLDGSNTYTGGTTVNLGTLRVTTSSVTGNIALGASTSLLFNQSTSGTYSGVVSGAGTLQKYGTGSVTLTGTNTYTGDTRIYVGTLVASADNNLGDVSSLLSLDGGAFQYGAGFSSARAVAVNAASTIDTNGFDSTLSGVVSGTGALTKSGTGTLTLSGTNTYTGGTTITAGTIAIGAGNNLGTGALTLNGGTLQYTAGFNYGGATSIGASGGTINSDFTSGLTGVLSGSGALTKTGTGQLSLTGANTYTGLLTVSAGAVTTNTGSFAADVVNNATFSFSQNNAGTFANTISGTGIVQMFSSGGTGVVTLTGNNTYTGTTRILSGAINVSSDANLGGAAATIQLQGGTLQYGAGFSSARSVILNASSSVDTNGFNSTLSGVVSGSNLLTKTGAGTLTLSGTNTNTGGITVTGGTVSVSADANMGASGAIALNGGTLQTTATFATSRAISTGASNGTVNIASGDFTSNGVISGAGSLTKTGSGRLILRNTNTFTGGLIVNAGIVNVSSDAQLGNLASSLTLNGGLLQHATSLTMARNVVFGASGGSIQVQGGSDISTMSGVFSGTGAFTKTGLGTLILSGTNTYTGGTTVSSGTLSVSSDANLGNTSGAVTLNGGTLLTTATMTTARNITLGVSGGTFGTNTGAVTYTINGIVSGSGSLTKTGTGKVTLNNVNNSYTGGTIISGGQLQGTTDSIRGDVSIASGADLLFGAVTNGTFSSIVSGAGRLVTLPGAALTLSSANTYSGGTQIGGSTITVSANNNLGDAAGALEFNAGTLAYNAGFTNARAVTLTGAGTINTNGFDAGYSGVISGAGLLTKTGAGTLTLSGTNTNTGGTTVTDGTVSISADAHLGNSSGALTLDGGTLQTTATLTMARNISLGTSGGTVETLNGNISLNGIISGTGALVKTGSTSLTLGGANTYTGGTVISIGRIIGTTTSIQGNVVNNGNLTFSQSFNGTYSGVVSGTGVLQKNSTGVLTLTGVNTHTGGTALTDGTVAVSADNNLGAAASDLQFFNGATLLYNAAFTTARNILLGTGGGIINTNGFDALISGNVSGAGAFTKAGAGTLTLGGTLSYTGDTFVTGGTLLTTTQVLQGNVTNNADVILDQNVDGTYGANMSGAGELIKDGTGTVILTGTNTYTGGTTVSDGRLAVNGSITGTTTVGASGELGGSGTTGTIVNNGRLAPGNSIGTLNVTGDVTFNNGSVYEVEVDGNGNSDLIIATGDIILNGGTVDVLATGGTYGASTNYTILQGATRTGAFTGVMTDLAFLNPTLGYTANSVTLNLSRNGATFSVVAEDEIQQGVADSVEDLGAGNPLYDAFLGLNNSQASQALDTLSGEHNVGLTVATVQSSSIIRNVVTRRLQSLTRSEDVRQENLMALRPVNDYKDVMPNVDKQKLAVRESDAANVLGNVSEGRGIWTEVFGSHGKTQSRGTAPMQNRESGGVLVGADGPVNERLSVGVLGGWERGEVYTNSQAANSDVESYHSGAYASYLPARNWRLSGGVTGSYHEIDTSRHVAFSTFADTAKGETQGYTASAYAEAGYTVDTNVVAFEPFMGLSVTHSTIDQYSEKEGGAANLEVESVSQTMPSHTIGVRIAKAIMPEQVDMNVRAHAGWTHNYGDLENVSTMRFVDGSTPFNIEGAQTARDAAIFGLGLDYTIGNEMNAYVDYNGSLAADERNHDIVLGVKVRF